MALKRYRVRLAFGAYRVGDEIEPTGLYASQLLSRGYIEPVAVPLIVAGPEEKQEQPRRRKKHADSAV